MASRSLDRLSPEFKRKTEALLEQFERSSQCKLLIYCTERSLEEQARLYRQSRSFNTIKQKIEKLNVRGFDYLADIIIRVGPQSGPHVTNAAPGESWHGYGEAFDCVPMLNGKCLWSYENNKQHWDLLGLLARNIGLVWSGDWKSFREYPHVQSMEGSNPLKVFPKEHIKELLVSRNLI